MIKLFSVRHGSEVPDFGKPGSKEWAQAVKEYTDEVILCYDNDDVEIVYVAIAEILLKQAGVKCRSVLVSPSRDIRELNLFMRDKYISEDNCNSKNRERELGFMDYLEEGVSSLSLIYDFTRESYNNYHKGNMQYPGFEVIYAKVPTETGEGNKVDIDILFRVESTEDGVRYGFTAYDRECDKYIKAAENISAEDIFPGITLRSSRYWIDCRYLFEGDPFHEVNLKTGYQTDESISDQELMMHAMAEIRAYLDRIIFPYGTPYSMISKERNLNRECYANAKLNQKPLILRYLPNNKELIAKDVAVVLSNEDSIIIDVNENGFKGSYTVFEIVETSQNLELGEIIRISAVKLSDMGFGEVYSSSVKAENGIPEEIMQFYDITKEEIENARSMEEVLPEFLEFIGEDILIGYKIKPMYESILQACDKFNMNFTNPGICTFYLSKALFDSERDYFGLHHFMVRVFRIDNTHPFEIQVYEVFKKLIERFGNACKKYTDAKNDSDENHD